MTTSNSRDDSRAWAVFTNFSLLSGQSRCEQFQPQRFGPWNRVLVRDERHRCDTVLHVALTAPGAKNREHVIVVVVPGSHLLVRFAGLRRQQRAKGAREDEHADPVTA